MEASWPRTGAQWCRLVGKLANLSTGTGLLVARLGGARIARGPRGLILGEGYRLRFPIAGAFTIGNVIITASTWEEILHRDPDLLRHEEAHTWQYLYCLGLPFLPAYGVCLVWSLLRTGNLAAGNFFERQAGLVSGGYAEVPAGSRPPRQWPSYSTVRSIPSRLAERRRCRVARSRRNRLTSSGS